MRHIHHHLYQHAYICLFQVVKTDGCVVWPTYPERPGMLATFVKTINSLLTLYLTFILRNNITRQQRYVILHHVKQLQVLFEI